MRWFGFRSGVEVIRESSGKERAGGSHKEPSIPCYFVTKLDDAMVRMVDIEMSGAYREPAREEIVRTGGNPRDGACVLSSGTQVVVF